MHVYYIVCSAYPFTNTVVLPCAQCRFLYCVVLSSDTFMLGWGHATVCAVPYARCASCPVSAQPTLFLTRYANLYTFGLDAYWLQPPISGELAYSVTIVGSIYVRILSAVFWGRAS